jgi:hypothetical protein
LTSPKPVVPSPLSLRPVSAVTTPAAIVEPPQLEKRVTMALCQMTVGNVRSLCCSYCVVVSPCHTDVKVGVAVVDNVSVTEAVSERDPDIELEYDIIIAATADAGTEGVGGCR